MSESRAQVLDSNVTNGFLALSKIDFEVREINKMLKYPTKLEKSKISHPLSKPELNYQYPQAFKML